METGKTGLEVIYTERYKACFELYLLHGGRNFLAIERGMRELGYEDFHRRILYTRKERGVEKPGWVEKFGWRRFLNGSLTGGNTSGSECVSSSSAKRDTLPTGRVSASASASQSFPAWLKQVSPELTWDWPYQKYIYKHLQRVTDGTCKRLMIFMPPRHGKSELVTVRYAGWRLWNDPKMRIIVSSYNQKLADRFSRGIRKLLSEEEDKRAAAMSVPSPAEAGGFPSPRRRNKQVNAPNGTDAPAAVPLAERKGSAFPEAAQEGSGGCASGEGVLQQAADYPQCSGGTAAGHFSQPDGKAEPFRTSSGTAAKQNGRMFPKTRNINTASQWETALGGGVKAVGVGAGVTGFGGQLIVIDDPVKSRAEAESATYRERLWDWYRNDLYTRLEPEAAVILIQTRWHQDDLAGRLLQEMNTGGDVWDVIDLPALAEHRGLDPSSLNGTKSIAQGKAESRNPGIDANCGTDPERVERANAVAEVAPLQGADVSLANPGVTLGSLANPRLLTLSPSATGSADPLNRPVGAALCPDRFDEAKLADIQRQLGTYNFSALYQQRPAPAEGGIFKRSWFTRFVDRAPDGLKWKRGYDLAVSTKTTSCFTASVRLARDGATGDIYIADGFRERIEYPDQKRFILERLAAEPDTDHGIEKALHGQALIQDLRREGSTVGANLRGIDVTTDKVTRALAWAPLAEEGKVVIVRGPWNRAFLDEVANFPAGEHDDQIDAVSLAFSMLKRKGGPAWGF